MKIGTSGSIEGSMAFRRTESVQINGLWASLREARRPPRPPRLYEPLLGSSGDPGPSMLPQSRREVRCSRVERGVLDDRARNLALASSRGDRPPGRRQGRRCVCSLRGRTASPHHATPRLTYAWVWASATDALTSLTSSSLGGTSRDRCCWNSRPTKGMGPDSNLTRPWTTSLAPPA